ncbi:MAG TPA: hypothetical protein DCY27_09965 [Desulfobacterales bacterium]|nr:hypothetical protein [Desulfobacterales bacterium]
MSLIFAAGSYFIIDIFFALPPTIEHKNSPRDKKLIKITNACFFYLYYINPAKCKKFLLTLSDEPFQGRRPG